MSARTVTKPYTLKLKEFNNMNEKKQNISETVKALLNQLTQSSPSLPEALSPEMSAAMENLKPQSEQIIRRRLELKEQQVLTETDVRTAMVYSKKELVEIRTSIQKMLRQVSDLPTYQYVKPQVDNLISAVDDLEALLLNRFNEKQIKSKSPEEWSALQHLREFFIRQLLEHYKPKSQE